MSRFVDEILAADRKYGLGVHLLDPSERDRIRKLVRSRYGPDRDRLWQELDGCASVQSGAAWRWIQEFLGPQKCVLLFDEVEETEMFEIPTGSALDELLSNTVGFEFYVTDSECTYVICYNHHDVLVCCGSAKEWLAARNSGSKNIAW